MAKQNREDYLRVFYSLCEETDKHCIRSVDVATYLKISKAAVSKMLKKLTDKGLIKMEKYSNIYFTERGFVEAEKLTYKHRVIEVFLAEILKINKKNIHEEAHKMEHSFSDEVIKKLAKYLNNPQYSPQGKKIPKFKK